MSIFNKLQFDDIDSLANGVYITGEAVYNAPERDVEMISIPGRNGELARDNKRFHNIEVKYRAGVKGDKPEDFARTLRAFRSLMASKRGYCRLVDSYHPDEYRLAVFKDAIEVEPAARKRAGEFDLVFDCKPQRFLMSGEAGIDIDHGDLGSGFYIFNPTPFEAAPLIKADGYGILTINDHEIDLVNETLGRVLLADSSESVYIHIDGAKLDTGNDIDIERVEFAAVVKRYGGLPGGVKITDLTSGTVAGDATCAITTDGMYSTLTMVYEDLSFIYKTDKTYTTNWLVQFTLDNGQSGTEIVTAKVDYYNNTFECRLSFMGSYTTYIKNDHQTTSAIYGDSTVSTLGNPTYIDCDLGEVYKLDGGSLVSLNHLVDLGSELPYLAPGDNEILGENSYNGIEIIPRWWLV